MNDIEDPMSSAVDLVKRKDSSTAREIMRVANAACFDTRNYKNMSSIEHAIAFVGLQGAKEDREQVVEADFGNMFAKKINLRDNFFSFDEFLNKYMDFACIEVKYFECI